MAKYWLIILYHCIMSVFPVIWRVVGRINYKSSMIILYNAQVLAISLVLAVSIMKINLIRVFEWITSIKSSWKRTIITLKVQKRGALGFYQRTSSQKLKEVQVRIRGGQTRRITHDNHSNHK